MNNKSNAGSIFYLEKRKRWVWVGTYNNEQGEKKKKWISALTQKNLREKIKDFTEELKSKTIEPGMNLEVWVEKWLNVVAQPMVSENTFIWYTHILKYIHFTCDIQTDKDHIVQYDFGNEKLNLITPIKVQELLRNLRYFGNKNHKKLAARTVNSFRRVLGMVLKSAMENDLIKSNPVLKVRPFKVPKDSIVVLDCKGIHNFLEIIKQGKYFDQYSNKKFDRERKYYKQEFYTLVSLGFASGMRISEICSLKWSDINFDEHYLQVKWVLKTENSYRKITLDSETINKLKEFKEFQNGFQENHKEYFHQENDLVFTSGTGKKLEPNNFREYYWYRMIKKASLPENFRIHCMRHTHATLLLENGVNIKVISKRLGHSTVEFTLKTYAHVIESMEESAASKWEEIMKE